MVVYSHYNYHFSKLCQIYYGSDAFSFRMFNKSRVRYVFCVATEYSGVRESRNCSFWDHVLFKSTTDISLFFSTTFVFQKDISSISSSRNLGIYKIIYRKTWTPYNLPNNSQLFSFLFGFGFRIVAGKENPDTHKMDLLIGSVYRKRTNGKKQWCHKRIRTVTFIVFSLLETIDSKSAHLILATAKQKAQNFI